MTDDNLPAVRGEVLEGVIDAECDAFCSHGGVCELKLGHTGKHDSGYCQWDDAGSISKQEADEIIARKPGGLEFLALEQWP